MKRRYDEALDRFTSAQSSETTSWDDQYEALGEILYSDPPYYLAASYKTARAFLAEHLPGVDERTAKRNIRVAKFFDPADEVKHRITKLDTLLDYLEQKGGVPLVDVKIHADRVRIHVTPRTTKLFPDIGPDELRAVVAKLKRGGEPVHTDSPAAKEIRGRLHDAKLDGATVSIRRDRVTIGNVLVADVAALGRALARSAATRRRRHPAPSRPSRGARRFVPARRVRRSARPSRRA